ncbi:threonine--tRNA ligase [Solirubrobacter phytolaccae]|uniref:Threonine--tRNA ligase n=1 Tax=Solirubrobacter phytolaccae TaxID=1404360 RepID=A0A9X3NAT6_9ACTN|nr:threonine--tRNA ligase [Solirubrobacter phytolaccae]MDA0182978.1 threonine--tRNA ligase [Solirubrobacter phytolaccae]
MRVPLPDGSVRELPDGSTGADLAADIGPGLARAALAIRVLDESKTEQRDGTAYDDGRIVDLDAPLTDGQPIEILTAKAGDGDALKLLRHDIAHVLAESVLELYPGTKVSIGPPIADGFYYDFDFPEGVTINEDDFPKIEAQMKKHVKAAEPFVRTEETTAEAIDRYLREDQPYKVELIEDLVTNQGVKTVGIYTNGEFKDLCRGPHAPDTGRAKAFKLTSVAGAYWRGDANRQMLTRIYGTAFATKDELKEHLERLEEARKRDHRRLGRELGLFAFSETATGSAFWLPHGTQLFNTLVGLSREMGEQRGYTEVKTPQLFDSQLWKTSGHWDKYRDNMFVTESEGKQLALKPMNCPGHCQLYKLQKFSYRDLPVRYSEPGLLHRNELSGTLHGLMRVRHFAQDDAHIFCTEDQLQDEVTAALEFAFATYRMFGFDVEVELSTRPEQRIGAEELWDRSEAALEAALQANDLEYRVNEGDGAFYGPKIDLHMRDSLGRSWQLGTVQLDYNFPERFELTYTGADNVEHRPVMIHRALMGSYERFIGILIEHYGGDFPAWLAPVQAIVLPVSDRHIDYANELKAQLSGFRVEVDHRTESIGRKIRDAELRKIPYMLVVGDREVEERTASVRRHKEGDQGALSVEALKEQLSQPE